MAIFLTLCVSDSFRPASFVAIKAYSNPDNQTRSISMIRMAINLGFAFGPFLGGLIISQISYNGLFWVDGITCIIAIITFRFVLKEKKVDKEVKKALQLEASYTRSALIDRPFIIFWVISFLMAFTFFQLFSTIPLFYKEVHNLNEIAIGLLMSVNGGLIFFIEMPVIHFLEKKAINHIKLVLFSLLLISASFFVLILTKWTGILLIGMIIITFGEIFGFPFSNVFALNRAPAGREGQYMSLFTMAFASAMIFSSKIGMEIVDKYGFSVNWIVLGSLDLLAFLIGLWLIRVLKKQS